MKTLRFIINTIANFINFGTDGQRQMKSRDEEIYKLKMTVKAQGALLAASKRKR